LPGEDLSFVDQLDEGGLRLFFDFIGEKDEGKREKMRAVLEQTLVETRTEKKILAQAFIQKANKLILGYRESLKQQEDNIDLEQLESNF
jgi:predicted transcriptional regulator